MKRRQLLGLLAAAGALGAITASGLYEVTRHLAGTVVRAPHDLVARLRQRTRALDVDHLDDPHELAG